MADLRRIRTPHLDGIVREIYASLSEDMSFERSLSTVGGLLGSQITALHLVDLRSGEARLEMASGWSAREFSDAAEEYATRWAGQNLWIARGIDGLRQKGYGTGEEVVSDHELIRTEYYQHFLKPVDVHFGLGINVLNKAYPQLAILTINRSKHAGAFRRHELLMVEQLRPHLINAYSICKRLNEAQESVTSLRQAFEHAPIGMLVMDASGHVVEQNAEAARLLETDAGISYGLDRTLRLTCPAARAKLRDALFQLGACAAPMPECLPIDKSGQLGAGSLVLHLCAFPASVSQLMVRNGRILGFLCELGRHSECEFGRRILQSALSLTPMEAAVVMSLREHNDPMRVVLHLGLAISTVRTHLKHVFFKTGTTRQSELLRLADRLLSVTPAYRNPRH